MPEGYIHTYITYIHYIHTYIQLFSTAEQIDQIELMACIQLRMCSVSINFKHVQPLALLCLHRHVNGCLPGETGLASFPSVSSSTYSRKESLGIRGTGFGRAMGPLCVLSVSPVCLSVCNAGVLWPNGWMDQGATWYRGRSRPRRRCVGWGPSSRTERGTAAPTFWSMSFVAKQSPISATAELVADWMPLCHSCRPSTVSKYWRTLRALVAAL